MKRHLFAALLLVPTMAALAAGSLPTPDRDDGAITLPPGFRALVVADNLGPLRFMTVASNGDVYAKMRTVGIIALAGLDAETGVVMLLYLDVSYRDAVAAGRMRHRGDLPEAVYDGGVSRVRPKMMTAVTTMVGLLPILWSTGTGADVMKRTATRMVGGMVTSVVVVLLVYPAIYYTWKGWTLPKNDTPRKEGQA